MTKFQGAMCNYREPRSINLQNSRLSHLPIRLPIVSLPANFSIELRLTFVLRPCNGHLNANTLFTYIYMQIRAFPGGRGESRETPREWKRRGIERREKGNGFVIPCNYSRFVVVLVRRLPNSVENHKLILRSLVGYVRLENNLSKI